jgi:group II intron reverse transcriptase/maturase
MKNLVLAYETLKSKPGTMTPGVDNITMDGIDIKYFETSQKKIKAGTYQFPPARRVMNPKPGTIEKRPRTVASPRDKIVQKAIQQVMDVEYEKIFLTTSHGFRPGRGTHTAAQYVDGKFQSVKFVIEADFSKAFDSIDHERLMASLRENISCEKVLRLIKSALKAGYVEMGNLHDGLGIGTPQGSVLSPTLCNIFLHKLDLKMEELKAEFNKGAKKKRNKDYERVANRIKYMKKKGMDSSRPEEFREKVAKLRTLPSVNHDDQYVRIHYVRYVDDFIVGVEGSLKTAKTLLARITQFVNEELGLEFNESKTAIVDITKNPIKFLGYKLMAPHIQGIEKPLETFRTKDGSRMITRRKKLRVRIAMDYDKVLKKLRNEGYVKMRNQTMRNQGTELRGTFKGNLINLDHADIISFYNSKIRGIYNYYNFVCNMDRVAHIVWLLTESCCLTLARKYKLKTMSQTYLKFGKDLGCNIKLSSGLEKRVGLELPANYQKIAHIAT